MILGVRLIKDFWILKIKEFPDNQELLSSRRQTTYKYNKFLEYLVVGERIDKEMTSLSVKTSAHFVMCSCVNAESDPILLILRPLLYVLVSPTGFDRAPRCVTTKTSAAGRPFGTRRALP